jgi:hypothetical protein
MKKLNLFNVTASIVGTFIFCALIFDGVMIYSHFFNEELENTIINKIDNVIY